MNPLERQCRHFRYRDGTPGIGRLGFGIAASDYQHLGCAVLPLARGGKRPHRMLGETGGVHHASQYGADVTRWWTADPAANVGIATGSASRLLVIDLDVKGQHNGVNSLRQFLTGLTQGTYDIPQGAACATPSGGWHIWLRTPLGLAVPERPGILPGVDIKGDGGLIVAPPSMKLATGLARPGEPAGQVPLPYRWSGGCACLAPEAPEWIFQWLGSAPAVSGSVPEGDVPDIKDLIKNGIPRGQRNATLYKLACSLYRKHGTMSREPAEAVTRVWVSCDRTDFPWAEVAQTLDSARRFVAGQERNDALLRQRTMGWLER